MEFSLIRCRRLSKIATRSSKRSRRQGWRRAAAHRSIQMKMRKLQRLIPGGAGLRPELLFSMTADYILQLRLQAKVLQALYKIYRPHELS